MAKLIMNKTIGHRAAVLGASMAGLLTTPAWPTAATLTCATR
jgi:hypothetical protein